MNFKQYQRKGLSEMRPYIKGEDLSKISISALDNPEEDMGMIARNPLNHEDQWYVARKYFDANLEPAKPEVLNKRSFDIIEEGTTYYVPSYKVVEGKGIEVVPGKPILIQFVRGSRLKEEAVDPRGGTLHEHLLSMMIYDLKYKNSLVPSRETATAITNLEQALHWLEEREPARTAQGVVGTYKPHK